MSQASLRFPKFRRLRKRPQYLEMARRGRRIHTRHFLLQVLPAVLSHGRLGVTVTRKVGGAVVRNHIKRRVREAFRTSAALRGAGLDLVVIAKSGARSLSTADVAAELQQGLDRLRRPGA